MPNAQWSRLGYGKRGRPRGIHTPIGKGWERFRARAERMRESARVSGRKRVYETTISCIFDNEYTSGTSAA